LAAAIMTIGLCFSLASCVTAQPGSCLAPASVAEPDIAANADALAHPNLCLTEQRFAENGVDWRLHTIHNTRRSGPLWVVPHDNEDAAFTAAVAALIQYGGTLVAVEAGEERGLGHLDPNRVFRPAGAAPEVCPSAPAGFPLFTAAVLETWSPSFPVIGMHTNADGYAGAGGAGTISIRRADERLTPFAATASAPPGAERLADEDTLVMLPSLTTPEDNPPGMRSVAWFNERGINVLYRRVAADLIECTLGDYLTLDGIGPYISIEAEEDDAATAKTLADAVMAFMESAAYAGML
jgi:hypothetical protein